MFTSWPPVMTSHRGSRQNKGFSELSFSRDAADEKDAFGTVGRKTLDIILRLPRFTHRKQIGTFLLREYLYICWQN